MFLGQRVGGVERSKSPSVVITTRG